MVEAFTTRTRLSGLLLSTSLIALIVCRGMRLLRGATASKVPLTIIRGNAGEPRQIDLVREKTPGAVVTGRMLGSDVGYIRVASFGADSVAKLRAQADALSKSGAKQLVVDIRHTAEGPFETGLDAARLFVKSGTLAMVAGRDAAKPADQQPPARPSDKPAKPSASAIKQTIAAKPGDGPIPLPRTP